MQSGSESHRREYRKFRPKKKSQKVIVCKFLALPEGCRFGEKCRFSHDVVDQIEKLDIEEEVKEVEPPATVYQPPVRSTVAAVVVPQIVRLKKEEMDGERQVEQRMADLAFFEKRFPKCKITQTGTSTTITFDYQITDPEWHHQIKNIVFCIELQPGHPITSPNITAPGELNECFSPIILEHMEKEVNKAIQAKYTLFEKRDAFETIGKALIRWLDNSVLEMFEKGRELCLLAFQPKEDIGFKLVMPKIEEKKSLPPTQSQPSTVPIKPESSSSSSAPFNPVDILPITVMMNWRDQSQNIATLRSISLKISTKCDRCSTEKTSQVPTNDTTIGWRCEKCGQAESLRIRGELVHQNSNIMAKCDAKGCKPIDCILLDSKFKLVCLGCDGEDDVQRINYGECHKSWCKECHRLLEFNILTIRFRGEHIIGEDRSVAGNIPKARKMVEKKMGGIEEGKPLPDGGTCKHYKKSYKWFRFPCCGRLYPCDTCHEEANNGDHEMKIANRLVCGHCSKEQPILKDKPCIGCGEETNRRRTQFWEGGKGCRDPAKMSRNDAHKFTNSRKKTVAKSAVGSLVEKKK